MSDLPPKSLVVIARLLDCEGFSDYTANQIKRYWNSELEDPRRKSRNHRTEQAFSEHVSSKLSESQKIVLGKWVALLNKRAFDSGLRLGLMTHLNGEDAA